MLYMKRSTDSIKRNNFKEPVKPHVPTFWKLPPRFSETSKSTDSETGTT